MKVLFDTNLWISFMIGKRLASLANVLCRNDVQVYMSEQLLEEIQTVIARPKFNVIISAESRLAFQDMVDNVCYWTPITIQAKSLIRDIKDLFILSMAESVPVDFIVSGDKDLTELDSHVGIPILSYSEFLNKLGL
ncbi:putative toxin-antitoxin system toxin component, PIN family [Fibrobacter sp.]|uniref:putative toxin-antitoxin system toxin component, PIN family n=1 Tax=Fibrobacter sp. TaxID=35828 RepID=UPI00262F5148|nr:putative toxin-antitoxin system toxin component, PIN family [Fibrobacter sp.]MDD5942930.1 putative toxin-antitoxin system toxin component, PIN family [Fibrobacter sp.]